ncbi:hypothetical protein VINI7043_26985 [Vibrio nigripulchritudo ATCC 27043]|nr:hypothetical protein VINI7043_26985 [Vibrio nigripulchritudo ATCC 27043]
MTKRIWNYFFDNPTIFITFCIGYISCVGLFNEFTFYQKYNINFLHFADLEDFLICGIRIIPAVLAIAFIQFLYFKLLIIVLEFDVDKELQGDFGKSEYVDSSKFKDNYHVILNNIRRSHKPNHKNAQGSKFGNTLKRLRTKYLKFIRDTFVVVSIIVLVGCPYFLVQSTSQIRYIDVKTTTVRYDVKVQEGKSVVTIEDLNLISKTSSSMIFMKYSDVESVLILNKNMIISMKKN